MTPGPRDLTYTWTYTTLFNTDQVDALVGGAHKELEADFEARKPYMTEENRKACETRLGLLRHTCETLKDRAD